MSTLPGGFYDYFIDQTSMQAEFIPIEHRESPKTLDRAIFVHSDPRELPFFV